MKKILINLLLVLIFSLAGTSLAFADNQVVSQSTTTTVTAATYQTPEEEAGTTPDSWLYTFEKWVESLQVLMTFNSEDKAELLAGLAKERLAESQILQNKEMYQLAGETLVTYVETVTAANLSAESAVAAGKDISEVISQISAVETQALEVVAKVADNLPLKTQKILAQAIGKQAEQLAKIDQKLTQKEAKVEEIQNALATARAGGDLVKVAELEKKLAEAQLVLAEATENAVTKLGLNQIKMVKAQLKIINNLGKKSVAEEAYEDDELDVVDANQKPAIAARKEAFRQAKEVKKEAFAKAKEAKKEAFQEAKDIRKEVRQQVYEEITEDIPEAREIQREAINENKEVKKEAIEKAKESRNEANQTYKEEKQKKEDKQSGRNR